MGICDKLGFTPPIPAPATVIPTPPTPTPTLTPPNTPFPDNGLRGRPRIKSPGGLTLRFIFLRRSLRNRLHGLRLAARQRRVGMHVVTGMRRPAGLGRVVPRR